MKALVFLFSIGIISSNLFASADHPNEKGSLSGMVTDKSTGDPLPGVNVYLPDLKTGTVSDENGYYQLENLPRTRVLVHVTYIGYQFVNEIVDLARTTSKDFALEESVVELHEVVVTGLSQGGEKNRTPTPISLVTSAELLQNSSTNIIDALAAQPGISQITTGSGISKPVIRGLGYNRVVTVNDGIRQEGQQWGDEHGIEIDEFSVSKVEILKGPASLTYGSDAMAGVINMLTAPTLPEGKIAGSLLANYQTNNGLIGYSAGFSGNKQGFIWTARASGKEAHAYQNRYDGFVFNSGFNENALGGILGLNKSWGYSHLHLSTYHFTPGIVDGERDSATGDFIKLVSVNNIEEEVLANDRDGRDYTIFTPYQEVRHHKAVLNNSFILGNSTLKATLGWQQNQRKEFGDVTTPGQYDLYFLLNTWNYDLRYLLPEHSGINLSFGVNGMRQNSQNKGNEFLVPEYKLFDLGTFVLLSKAFDKLDLSGGLRFDLRNETGEDLFLDPDGEPTESPDSNSSHQFAAFNTTFTGISGSIGATYQFSERAFVKINLSRGYRAPNIAELASNGVHEGTLRYETGDVHLRPETSLQLDLALGLNTEHINLEIDLFNNTIDHFIYSRGLKSFAGGDSLTAGYRTFRFFAGNARLTGGEFTMDVHPHPLDWLHFENSFSYVRSIQPGQSDSTRFLPLTPAPKYSSELKAVKKKIGNHLANAYAQFGVDYYFRKSNVYSAFGTETPTPAYTLLNFGFGTDIVSATRTLCSLYVVMRNITDVAYQSHLSRLKYADVNLSTGRKGVFDPGRNVSLKLIVPLDFGT